jgi:DHA3 family macrolide efflux protein-like MFS transporter
MSAPDTPVSTKEPRERLGRPFWWLWAGQSVSGLGSTAQALAMPLWVLHETGSAALTGGAFAVQLLPRVLFSPWAGVLADRFDRRGLSVVLNLLAAVLTAALLPVLSARDIPLYYVLSVLLGALSTLNAAVLPSLTPALVPPSKLVAADAAQEVTSGAILALGPLLGAAIAVVLGFSGAVAVNAASFALAALLTTRVPRQPPATGRRRRPAVMLREGFQALLGDRVLRTAVMAESALFLFLGALPQFAVLFVGQGGRTAEAGLFSSGMGAGWLLMSASVARRRRNLEPTVMLAIGAVGALPVGVAVALCAQAAAPWVFFAGLLTGAHNLLFAMAPTLLCQRRAEPAVLGRVIAFRRSFVVAAQCVSLALATALSPLLGFGIVLAGAGAAATAAALPVAWRAVRRARREQSQVVAA